MITCYVGYDEREALAYHVFCQSVIDHASVPVAFHPLSLALLRGYEETHTDGSNAFIYTRFLVPALQDFAGWALFVDGDMVCTRDLAEVWALRNSRYAVQVVRHADYRPRDPLKYRGSSMETGNPAYQKKNWSSVILWNCAHPSNRVLTPALVQRMAGSDLHRFSWLKDDDIGALPDQWNVLIGEQKHPDPAVCHYTNGVPGIGYYANCDHADKWFAVRNNLMRCG